MFKFKLLFRKKNINVNIIEIKLNAAKIFDCNILFSLIFKRVRINPHPQHRKGKIIIPKIRVTTATISPILSLLSNNNTNEINKRKKSITNITPLYVKIKNSGIQLELFIIYI